MSESDPLPEFERPPVIEVVCGVLFKSLDGLLAPHVGLLWERFRESYPRVAEVPPLSPIFEAFGEPPEATVTFSDTPPLARTWLIHADETALIQIQRDRFLHNWKKVREADEYPRYVRVVKDFRERLATFETFLADTKPGVIDPLQYELTYVNHIPRQDRVASISEIRRAFPDFAWREESRFLPAPEAFNWRTVFVLPNQVGRLHVSMRTWTRPQDGSPMLLLDLTARGMPNAKDREGMWSWFDLAHEWIVRGFADVTGQEFQHDVWRRAQ